jgi:hypothetical protein
VFPNPYIDPLAKGKMCSDQWLITKLCLSRRSLRKPSLKIIIIKKKGGNEQEYQCRGDKIVELED